MKTHYPDSQPFWIREALFRPPCRSMQITASMPSLDLCIATIVPLEAASVLTGGVGCTWRWLFLDGAWLEPLQEKSIKPGSLVITPLLSRWLEGISIGRVPRHQGLFEIQFVSAQPSPAFFWESLSTFFSRHILTPGFRLVWICLELHLCAHNQGSPSISTL